MSLTRIPSPVTKVPSVTTNIPSVVTDIPTNSGLTRIPGVAASGGGNHLLDGSANILAITVGVDQLTNA